MSSAWWEGRRLGVSQRYPPCSINVLGKASDWERHQTVHLFTGGGRLAVSVFTVADTHNFDGVVTLFEIDETPGADPEAV